jgi:ribosomal protein L40E
VDALDGNAIAGQLFEFFGREMTAVSGACGHCGARAPIAELRVYVRAPGTVVRCRRCGQVVIVLADIGGRIRADLEHFKLHEPAAMET